MKKRTGIWIDKSKALIVSIDNNDTVLFSMINSEVEDFHIGGGSGTRFKGGPQDVVQDSRYLEREKHQLKKYFKKIISQIKDLNKIVVFGPSEAKEKFKKELELNYKEIDSKIIAVKTADSMTNNQVIAWVKDFFNKTI